MVGFELKLQLDAAQHDKAPDILPEKSRRVQQRAIHFDTADRALAAAGLSLRIRESDGKRVQTVVTGDSVGHSARSDWEQAVEDDLPVIDEAVHVLLGGEVQDLVRVFEVEATRRIWDVEEGDAKIELVIDRGMIRAGDRQTPVHEMALKLLSGPPKALFDLARKLDGAHPPRLGVLSKAERGELLTQALRGMVKAAPVPLDGDMTAAEAFQAIVLACLKQFRLNEDLLLASRSDEALHQARVALRRLRSAFSIVRPLLGADDARDLRNRLRDLAGELGPARDLDVLLQRAKPGALRDRLRAEREASYDRVEAVLRAPDTRRLMLDLVEWTHCGPWLHDPETEAERTQPARTFAGDALNRFRRKVKKGGERLKDIDDEARHELRKDAKKLRYAAEFFRPLFDGKGEKARQKAFIAALEELQDELGALNDLATAPHVLDRLGIAADPEAAALVAGGKKKPLIAAAADAHADLVEADRYWR